MLPSSETHHIYGTDLFNASVDLDECGKFQNFQSELHIQNFQKGPHPAYLCKICVQYPSILKRPTDFGLFEWAHDTPPSWYFFLKSKFSYQLGGCREPIQKSQNQLVFLILRGTIQIFYIYMLDGVIFGNFGYVIHPRSFKIFRIRRGPRTH